MVLRVEHDRSVEIDQRGQFENVNVAGRHRLGVLLEEAALGTIDRLPTPFVAGLPLRPFGFQFRHRGSRHFFHDRQQGRIAVGNLDSGIPQDRRQPFGRAPELEKIAPSVNCNLATACSGAQSPQHAREVLGSGI